MTYLQAIVLGAVQGVTEFLPISSTAHLILVPVAFGWQDPGLTFDVALHVGTFIAVVAYFAQDLKRLARAWITSLYARNPQDPYQQLAWLIVLGSVPAAVVGVTAESWIETTLRSPLIVGTSLLVVALAILSADKKGHDGRSWKELRWQDALAIGIGQAAALIPGFSRSGSTMLVGLWRGLDRESAARFSFLLGTPIIVGSCLFKLRDLLHTPLPPGHGAAFAAGIVTAAVVGYLSIRFLLNWLARKPLASFMYYRIVVGVVVIGLTLAGVIGAETAPHAALPTTSPQQAAAVR